jgi:hypothetical protein
MVRVLALFFDVTFFASLAFLVLGGVENEFAFLPITFVLSGAIVQAILLRRFKRTERQLHFAFVRRKKIVAVETKVCRHCNRAISADAVICRFCLTEVDGHPTPSMNAASQTPRRAADP